MGREVRNVNVAECYSRNIRHGKSLSTITSAFLLLESIMMTAVELSLIKVYVKRLQSNCKGHHKKCKELYKTK